jgi:hypothetical protein
MLFLHSCLFGLNVFTELGTKLLFLLIKKIACKNKHQKVASQASVTSSFLSNSNNMSGVIGDACFEQCGFNLDNPFNIKFK